MIKTITLAIAATIIAAPAFAADITPMDAAKRMNHAQYDARADRGEFTVKKPTQAQIFAAAYKNRFGLKADKVSPMMAAKRTNHAEYDVNADIDG